MIRATFTKFVAVPLSCVVLLSTSVATQGQTAPPKTAAKAKAAGKVALDLNTATAEELEAALPGVGPAMAKRIIAARPYATVNDLAKAGLPRRVLENIRPLVTVGSATPAAAKTTTTETAKTKVAEAKVAEAKAAMPKASVAKASAPKETPTGKVNINTADLAALEALPGVGPVIAKAIIDGRPWKSVDELRKIRGLGRRFLALQAMVTVGEEPAPAAAKTASPAAAVPKSSATATTKAMPKLEPGHKVNINTATQAELDVLPGIGPVKAAAIIAARPFKTIEDIKNVKGIKDIEFSKIQDLITVK